MSNVEKTLAERGSRYGDFSDHAAICQKIKRVMMHSPGWNDLNDVQRQALDVIADKIARILSGDPNYADNWHDIQGYAKLVEDRLPKFGPEPSVKQDEAREVAGPRETAFGRLFKEVMEKAGDPLQPRNASEGDIPEEVLKTIHMLRNAGIKLSEITVYDNDLKTTRTFKI